MRRGTAGFYGLRGFGSAILAEKPRRQSRLAPEPIDDSCVSYGPRSLEANSCRFPKRLAVRLAAVMALSLSVRTLTAATPVSPPVVEYTLEAKLDPATHTLEGQERLIWRNPSGDPVSELRFHLYLNAFKNNRSIFARESGGQLRGDKAGHEAGGLGMDRRPLDEDGLGRGPEAGGAIHPA